MKSIRFILAMLLYSTLFISCSNTETDEDLKLYENEEFFAEDTGEDPPPPPPVDPGDD
jgi:hypothetical protein